MNCSPERRSGSTALICRYYFVWQTWLKRRSQMPKDYAQAVAVALWNRIQASTEENFTPRKLHKAIDEEYLKVRQQYLAKLSSM
jgi:hypothetical protein